MLKEREERTVEVPLDGAEPEICGIASARSGRLVQNGAPRRRPSTSKVEAIVSEALESIAREAARSAGAVEASSSRLVEAPLMPRADFPHVLEDLVHGDQAAAQDPSTASLSREGAKAKRFRGPGDPPAASRSVRSASARSATTPRFRLSDRDARLAGADEPTRALGGELAHDIPAAPVPHAKSAPEMPPETTREDPRVVEIDGEASVVPPKGGLRIGTPRPSHPPTPDGGRGGGGGGGNSRFHRRLGPADFAASYGRAIGAVRRNLAVVILFTLVINALVLAIPIYLFQISDRVLTSRSLDTLVMLTVVVVGAIVVQAFLDAQRRHIMMRSAVEVEAQLGAPILAAAARSSLSGSGKDYQVLGDLQSLRSFLTSGTLIAFLDAPVAPLFIVAVFLVHPDLGWIVIGSALGLLVVATINQRLTMRPFREASQAMARANVHLDSMTRNAQIINALAMIPEAVQIWGRDTAISLKAQVRAQDRNIWFASVSRGSRMLTQVAMLGWGAFLAIEGFITGGMVIAASIIAGRALAPIEGTIEGWNQFAQTRVALGRIKTLLNTSTLNTERLHLPRPEGRLDVERLLYVPRGTKNVILNGVTFRLMPGESLGVIGNSGAGKTTLGKMLVGSILPTSGSVRLDLMDLRNWDPRQFGESIGYLPQDVQLFPGTIKQNIGRMRADATDEAIFEAAQLADVHELIASLPQGYETFVGADGAPLSGGQKQRIALARAFFGNPRLVVLDEPNSNLDMGGEAALARALEHAARARITVVAITQRPSLLKCVSKIMVLKAGSVAAFGERADILARMNGRGAGSDEIEGGAATRDDGGNRT